MYRDKITKRNLLALASLAISSRIPFAVAQPSGFPQRPLRILVGSTAGGSSDNVARVVAEEMAKNLGQPIVIQNRAGASANIAAQAVVAAPADGYSMLLVQYSHLTNPALLGSLGYDPFKDLTMVGQLTSLPVVALTRANSPFNNLRDVVAAAKAKGGDLSIGSGGNGTSSHIAAELLARAMGFKYLHIPYKGGAPALQGLLGGEIDLTFDFVTPAMQGHANAGAIKFLGAMQSESVASLPKLVPASQQGIPASAFIRPWQGLGVRAGTPDAVLQQLYRGLNDALGNPSVVSKLEAIGTEVVKSASPAAMQDTYIADAKRWSSFIKSSGIRSE